MLAGCVVALSFKTLGQAPRVDKKEFFKEDKMIEAVLSSDLGMLLSGKSKEDYLPADLTFKFPDSSVIKETIRIRARGQFRRTNCYVPSLKLNFHNESSPQLHSLNSLKLVCGCKTGFTFDQLLLREYVIYKMYNLITDKSFRVRLLHVRYEDSKGKKKPLVAYAFLIEDINDMAKRNHCREWTKGGLPTEVTNRQQMTTVAIFQYMIANTDWAVPVLHNIRLIYPKDDSTARPFAVAYDFDFAGLVNPDYAIPDPKLGIESVRDRLYRGFPRTMGELQEALQKFKDEKDKIYSLINNFELLSPATKKDMTGFLDDFYKTINNESDVKYVFIDNARRE